MALSTQRLFVVILWLGILILPVHEIVDPDYWWHLRTGQQILQQRSLPHTDIYSFTSAGKTWIAHEWLSEVVMYSIYQIAGHAGVVLMFALVLATAFVIVYRRCLGKPFLAGMAVFLGGLASAPTLGARPQMFTVLFASVFLAVLGNYRHGGPAGRLWWLVPLMVPWVNLHGGFAVGPGLIALTCVGLVLDQRSHGMKAASILSLVRPLLYVLLACTAVVAINPNGIRLYAYPFATIWSSASKLYITEWASPDFHRLAFQALAALMLCTFGVLALSPKRPGFGDLLLLLVTCYAALHSARHIPLFVLVAIPLLCQHAFEWFAGRCNSSWLNPSESPVTTSKAVLNTALLTLLVLGFALRTGKALEDQQAHESERWPLAAVQFIQSHAPPLELYNNYDWGGYLIWKLYPQYRVSIDGRADVHGDRLVAESVETYKGIGNWENFLTQHSIHTVLVGLDAPLANLLGERCEWEKVFADTHSVIFVKQKDTSKVSSCYRGAVSNGAGH